MFVIFINDLPDLLETLCKIFADDTKIYNSTKNHKLLQKDLLTLMKWSEMWQLGFNIDKCCVLHGGNRNEEEHKYYMDPDHNHRLKRIDTEKDVGVIFSGNLKFEEHINTIVSEGKK